MELLHGGALETPHNQRLAVFWSFFCPLAAKLNLQNSLLIRPRQSRCAIHTDGLMSPALRGHQIAFLHIRERRCRNSPTRESTVSDIHDETNPLSLSCAFKSTS